MIEFARLPKGGETRFDYAPDEAARRKIIDALGLRALRKVRLEGELVAEAGGDWLMTARLGATAVQDCVVTLEPVTTRVDTDLSRRYLADPAPPPEGEAEMPEDDSAEPLPARLDLRRVLTEALALALPDYPRADGAALGAQSFTEPGKTPMKDEDARPFAALKALRGGGSEGTES